MNEEKRVESGEATATSTEPARADSVKSAEAVKPEAGKPNVASRARNQTVMLSPELTGQVRNMIGKNEGAGSGPDPLSELLPPMGWDKPTPTQPAVSAPPAPPTGGMPYRSANGDFGGDITQQSELNAGLKRPTGRMSPRATSVPPGSVAAGAGQHSANPAGHGAGHPQATFSVNTQMSKATASGVHQSHRGTARAPEAQREAKSRIVGFLISFDKNQFGEVFEIRVGRFLLSSRATEHGEAIIIEDETISPLHAIIRAANDGRVQVLDQLSEFGTGVMRAGTEKEDEVAGAMVNINHGDTVRFGKRQFTVCLVPKGPKDTKAAGDA